MNNLLLIDDSIENYNVIIESLNTNTKYIIFNFISSTLDDIKLSIDELNLTNFNSIGIVQHNNSLSFFKFIENLNIIFFDDKSSWTSFIDFINYLKLKYNITSFDFFACALYLDEWKIFIDELQLITQININASIDNTGSTDLGGNWILETNNNINLKDIYFTNNIDNYKGLLGSAQNTIGYVTTSASNDQVYVMGNNVEGYIVGNNMGDPLSYATAIPSMNGVSQITFGNNFTVIVKMDGTVYTCGNNGFGKLGHGDTFSRNYFQQIGGFTNVNSASAGYEHVIYLKNDGNVYVTGRGDFGQLGQDYPNEKRTPTLLTSLTSISAVSCGSDHSVFLKSDGSVYICGYSGWGRLAVQNNSSFIVSPTLVIGGEQGGAFLTNISKIAAGASSTLFLTSSGNVYGIGENSYGRLGNGSSTNFTFPKKVLAPNGVADVGPYLSNITAISSGLDHSLFLSSDNKAYSCGNNQYNKTSNSGSSIPIEVALTNVTQISASRNNSLFLVSSGVLYSCGWNGYGSIGIGYTDDNGYGLNTVVNATNVKLLFDNPPPKPVPQPTFQSWSIPLKTINDPAFNIVGPTSNSNGAITYTSSNTAVATISGSTITIVSNGTSTITATQASTVDYSVGVITSVLTVVVPGVYAMFWLGYTSNSVWTTVIGTIGYTYNEPISVTLYKTNQNYEFSDAASAGRANVVLSNLSPANIATLLSPAYLGFKLTAGVYGTFTANPGVNAGSGYQASSPIFSITVTRPTAVYTGVSGNSLAKNVDDPNFNAPAITTTPAYTGSITYSSSNTAVATVNNSTGLITLVGAGSTDITYSFNNMDSPIPLTLNVTTRINPTLSAFTMPAKNFGDSSFNITAPTSNSTGAITYTSSDTSVATISGSTVTIVGGGTTTITATQAQAPNYFSGTITASLIVSRINSTFSGLSIPAKTFGDSSFNITAPTSNSNGAITYTSSDTSVATISGSTVTIVGGGTTTITATQAQTTNYLVGTLTASLVVSRINPTIGALTTGIKKIGDVNFTLINPSTNSAGSFTYTSSNTAVATVSGNIVTFVGGGTTTITANQSQTNNYNIGSVSSVLTVMGPGTSLSGADLSGVNLSGTNLTNSNLSGTNLTGTTITNVDFTNVNISGANITGLTFSNKQKLQLLKNSNNRNIATVSNLSTLSGTEIVAALPTSTAAIISAIPNYTSLNFSIIVPPVGNVITINSGTDGFVIPTNTNETFTIDGIVYYSDGTNIIKQSNSAIVKSFMKAGKIYRLLSGSAIGVSIDPNSYDINGVGFGSIFQQITDTPTYSYPLTITNNTNSSSAVTGALIVSGGVGIGGNIYFNGNLYQNGVLFSGGGGSSQWTTSGNNIYYNTGNVGIGTNPSYDFHIQRNKTSGLNNYTENLSSDVNAFTLIGVRNNNGAGAILFINSSNRVNDGGVSTATLRNDAGDLRIQSAGAVGMMIKSNTGYVGIGTNDPTHPLTISNSAQTGSITASTFIQAGNTNIIANNTYNWGFSLVTSSSIRCGADLVFYSDSRIKKDIIDIDDSEALVKLRLIKPKKYKYKDTITRTSEEVYGFIAQEVKTVLTNGVGYQREYIPNFYCLGDIVLLDEMTNRYSVTTLNNILFETLKDKDGNILNESYKVKFYGENNIIYEGVVISFENNNTLIVDLDKEYILPTDSNLTNKIFVYGQQITDFNVLNKEAIWTLATSALQEVDRQQQLDKLRIIELESKVLSMENTINSIITKIGGL